MDRSLRTAAIVVLALLFLSAATLMAGCTRQQPLSVKLTDHPTYGKILTDSNGKSLYILARDVPNTGAVSNLGEVGHFYPPFYAESVVNGNGINISEFGHITRADGKQQTTFRGWPLYYYINDKEVGDAKSQGANNITFLAKPDYTVMVRENVTLGIYLSDTTGAPLLARDNSTGAGTMPGCVPFRASPVVGPSPLIQSADFGEVKGSTGEVQTTYRGQPLYSYSDRTRPGMVPQDGDGYHAIILASGGTLTGVVEAPTPAPSPSSTMTEAASTATTAAPVTTAATTAATRSGDGSYTGGEYTPTPYQTVQVISQNTESSTPISTWTPVSTVSALPTASTPPTQATSTVIATTHTTTAQTTVPITKTPATSRTTVPPTMTARATTVPVPVTTPQTTAPVTSATTLPLPFPIATQQLPNPAGSIQAGNGS